MNRLRMLLLPAIFGLLLVLPGSAAATTIETQSNPNRGQLTTDIHKIGPSQYRWNHLHYRLNSCGGGDTTGAVCHWELWGRISSSWVHCPEHELERPEGMVLTSFRRFVSYGNPVLQLGLGHIIVPESWGSGRQVICWYTQISDSPDLTLTAHTMIKQ